MLHGVEMRLRSCCKRVQLRAARATRFCRALVRSEAGSEKRCCKCPFWRFVMPRSHWAVVQSGTPVILLSPRQNTPTCQTRIKYLSYFNATEIHSSSTFCETPLARCKKKNAGWRRCPLERVWGMVGQRCAQAYRQKVSLQGDCSHFSPPQGASWPSRKRFLCGFYLGCRVRQPNPRLAANWSESAVFFASTP